MYLPSEGLYSEVHRIPGLIETLRRTHQVMVMGPSVLPGLLHCIRVGHLTLALERKAGAIGEILSAVKAEWAGLGKALDDMARRAQTLSKGIGDAQRRNRGVGRALATVDALDPARAQQVLGLAEPALRRSTPKTKKKTPRRFLPRRNPTGRGADGSLPVDGQRKAAGSDAAKIATIALHTARLIYPRQGSLMRCFNLLLGCGKSLFGSAGFPGPRSGKIPQALVVRDQIRKRPRPEEEISLVQGISLRRRSVLVAH